MAKYRAIYQKIWKDPDFQLYTPESKLLFIYLCTNESTTESGLYPLTIKTISDETGIPSETVAHLLNNGLRNVTYDLTNHCIFVKNFRKYNAGGKPDLIKKSIAKDYLITPNTPLWQTFVQLYPDFADVLPTYSKPLPNGSGEILSNGSGSTNGNGSTNTNSKGSSSTTPTTTSADDEEGTIFKIYMDNFGLVSSAIITEELKDIAANYPHGYFGRAVKEAFESAKGGKPNLKYIRKIMDRWMRDGTTEGYNRSAQQGRGERDYTGGSYGKLATVSE